MKIASELNLTINSASANAPFGGRLASVNLTDEAATWPYLIDGNAIQIPPLHIHFHQWFFLSARRIALPASPAKAWLRIKMAAETTTSEAIDSSVPVDVTITANPVYEWRLESLGIPDDEPGSGAEVIHYTYLLCIQDGRVLSSIYNTPLIVVAV